MLLLACIYIYLFFFLSFLMLPMLYRTKKMDWRLELYIRGTLMYLLHTFVPM